MLTKLIKIINIKSSEHLINNGSFLINYSLKFGRPIWTAYSLTRNDILNQNGGRKRFVIDKRLKTQQIYQLEPNSKIFGKHFSRGHLVPAFMMSHNKNNLLNSNGIHPSPWYRTFQMSNVIPQNKKFNMGKWHMLEYFTKKIILQNNHNVYVIVGCESQNFSKKFFFSEKNFETIDFLHNYQMVWVDDKSEYFYYIPNIMYKVIITPYEVYCYIGTNDSNQIIQSVSLDFLEKLINKKLII